MRKALICALGLSCLLCIACTEPNPLYGGWADNRGNKLTLSDDGTFSATIKPSLNYSGNYSSRLNVLALECTELDMTVVTEWDVRGNILYLDWVISGSDDTLELTLFKIN